MERVFPGASTLPFMAHGWYIPQIMQEPLPKHPLNIITLPFFSWRDLHPDPRCKYAVCWIIHKWYGSFRSVVLILFKNLIKSDKTLHAMCIMYLMRFDCLIHMRESLKSSSRQYKKNYCKYFSDSHGPPWGLWTPG